MALQWQLKPRGLEDGLGKAIFLLQYWVAGERNIWGRDMPTRKEGRNKLESLESTPKALESEWAET